MSPKKKLNTDDMVTELSESAFFQPTSPLADKPTKPQTEKYTTHLLPETILAIKIYAAQHKMRDYEVAQKAFEMFLSSDWTPEK